MEGNSTNRNIHLIRQRVNLGQPRPANQGERPPLGNPNVVRGQQVHQLPLAQVAGSKGKGTKENLLTVLQLECIPSLLS
jgi:hypothetical protein